MAIQLQKFDSQTVIVPDSDALADVTAGIIIRAFTRILAHKDRVVFIPSSGQTPLKTYQLLARQYKTAIDWSRVTVVQMDEYASANLSADAYFQTFLQTHLVKPLGIGDFISMHKPGGNGLYLPSEFKQILNYLGPIDFALHGIGRNGHIGFNEPGSSLQSETRHVTLSEPTRTDNFPHMNEADRPLYGMTMGLSELRDVAHTLLIASGRHKALAMYDVLNRNSVSKTPASVLWDSPDFGLICDHAAADLVIGGF